MRILDINGNEIINPDLSLGHLENDKIFVAHHEAVDAVSEQGHYEVVAEYPETGGKDVEWIIDVQAVDAQEAWDEYEDVMRYVLYTDEELKELNKPTQLDIIEAQVAYTAMMTNTLLEV